METPEQDAVREPAHPRREADGTIPEERWIPMIPSDWDMEDWQAYLAEKAAEKANEARGTADA